MRSILPQIPFQVSRAAAIALCLSPGFAICTHAQADAVGLTAEVSTWQADIEGDFRSDGTTIDLQDDLGLDDNDAIILRLAVEHPVAVLPNIAVGITDLTFDASSQLNRSIVLENTTFSFSDRVDSDIDLSHVDATFYYEVLDSVLSIDLGLTARWFHGDLSVTSTSANASADFDVVLPLLYGRTQVDLPLTGLAVAAQVQGASYDGNGLTELSAEIQYAFSFGLGLKAGYRSLSIDVDDVSDVYADVDISGGFLGLYFDL